MTESRENAWDELYRYVESEFEQSDVPGVAFGTSHEGTVKYGCMGVTNAELSTPVHEDSLFQIGSITKTFTATALLRLVERGDLDLDAQVRTYLPDFRVADDQVSQNVRVRNLLTHTSGWFGDFFHDTGAGDDAIEKYVSDMSELEQITPLGEIWSYNNSAFVVAGRILETITGSTYESALDELVLSHLGLDHCFFRAEDVISRSHAVGHITRGAKTTITRPWAIPRGNAPAGGIVTSISELIRYGQVHLDGRDREGAEVLSPETVADMQTSHASIWKDRACGLSWHISQNDGVKTFNHGGTTNGQIASLTLIPENDLVIAVVTNSMSGGSLVNTITERAQDAFLGLEDKKTEPRGASPAKLLRYVGMYRNPAADVELGILNGRLIGQQINRVGFPTKDSPPLPTPPPVWLDECEENRLIVREGPLKDVTLDAFPNDSGVIRWIRVGGRIAVRDEGS